GVACAYPTMVCRAPRCERRCAAPNVALASRRELPGLAASHGRTASSGEVRADYGRDSCAPRNRRAPIGPALRSHGGSYRGRDYFIECWPTACGVGSMESAESRRVVASWHYLWPESCS